VGGPSCIASATREAMIQAQAGIAAIRDELAFTTMAEAAGMVSIGVEFAGALIPVDFQSFGEMDRALSPGLDGIAIRIADKLEATFPSVILQRTIAPSLASAAAAARITGDPALGLPEAPDAQPAKVRETRKATYYRFRVRHLAQTEPSVPPVFLQRGGKVFDQSRLDVNELRRWADGLARNLVARRWTGQGAIGMSGTDWPLLGKTDPAIAGPGEQSLAILALCDYLAARTGVGRFDLAPRADRDAFGAMALILADELLTVEDTEIAPWSEPISAASTIVALRAVQRVVQPRYVPTAELMAKLDEPLLAAFSPESGWSPTVPEPARGLIAWAMLIRAGDDPREAPACRQGDHIHLPRRHARPPHRPDALARLRGARSRRHRRRHRRLHRVPRHARPPRRGPLQARRRRPGHGGRHRLHDRNTALSHLAHRPPRVVPGRHARRSAIDRIERAPAPDRQPHGQPPLPPPALRLDLEIQRELQDSYLTYAMSTIMDRALPDVRDGLKPSGRRILVAMNDLKLRPGKKHLKCAKICGNTSGDYHPHGEAVVYPTMVGMAQAWKMRVPLVDPQGNFGSIDPDPPAAMRYTEARMTMPRWTCSRI
jgi:hypothetical protein